MRRKCCFCCPSSPQPQLFPACRPWPSCTRRQGGARVNGTLRKRHFFVETFLGARLSAGAGAGRKKQKEEHAVVEGSTAAYSSKAPALSSTDHVTWRTLTTWIVKELPSTDVKSMPPSGKTNLKEMWRCPQHPKVCQA